MSDLFRQHVNGNAQPPRPKPKPNGPLSIPEEEAAAPTSPPPCAEEGSIKPPRPLSTSSTTSTDSATSAQTLRPSSPTQEPQQPSSTSTSISTPPPTWQTYFTSLFHLPHNLSGGQKAIYQTYITPPLDPKKGPLFICHHGAGASALSFAILAQELRLRLPEAGILALSARSHGSVVNSPATGEEVLNFALETLVTDAETMINLTQERMGWSHLPPTILVGHSLGGAILTHLASTTPQTSALGSALVGLSVLDVVEGSALEALGFMNAHLASRPREFASVEDAIEWHLRSRTLRSRRSAEVSVPDLLVPVPRTNNSTSNSPSGPPPGSEEGSSYTWRTPLPTTVTFWPTWFTSMSNKFLTARCGKQLILAGTDRLDKPLMIGQMQGKFQLVVVPEAGHFVHEDCGAKVAEVLVEFWGRNERGFGGGVGGGNGGGKGGFVMPMKVSEMLERGMKV